MRQTTQILFLLIAAGGGCSTPNSQLATCQAEKEQLLSTIRGQRETTRGLQTQVASLETRLDQAEKELARAGSGTRISSRPSETPPGIKPAVKSESLPWRSPPPKAEVGSQKSEVGKQGSAASSLLAIARRDRRLQYDAAARAAKINVPIAFDDKTATLTADDKRQLDGLAELLKSDDARELRVMVAGFAAGRPTANDARGEGDGRFTSSRQLGTARAQAVADYLDRHGIAQERLGISGAGSRGVAADGDKLAGNAVQIYLLDPDAPVVGWGPTDSALRR